MANLSVLPFGFFPGLFLAVIVGVPWPISGQTFTKVTTGDIVTDRGNFVSCAWGYPDNTGHPDLFVADSGYTGGISYKNNGDGNFLGFRRILNQAYYGISQSGCAWGDFNNDGAIELLTTGGAIEGAGIYLHGANPASLADGFPNASSPVLGDLDNDGNLDLLVGLYYFMAPGINGFYWYRNRGGSFRPEIIPNAWGNTTLVDYDNDGDLDLYSPPNLFLQNNGDGSFTQILEGAQISETARSSVAAWGDYDNDGYPDLFVANTAGQNNFLFHNNGNGTFTKVTDGAIVDDGGNSVGCEWGDFDNDGWLDLFVLNSQEKSFLYLNNGDGTFARITEGEIVNDAAESTACALADYDNDGFVDVFVTNTAQPFWDVTAANSLYHNDGNRNSWIKIRCVGSISNRAAIGAKVRAKATIAGAERWQMREISGGNGRSQNEIAASFGFGLATNIDTIRIEWPSGVVQELHNVVTNQFLTLTEEGPTVFVFPKYEEVVAGSSASFAVLASITGPLRYQWQFNGVDIPGETNVTLLLENVQANNVGHYIATVSKLDPTESVTSLAAFLTLTKPPIITTQPSDQSASLGASATFEVAAQSRISVSYQWLLDGRILSAATNAALVLTNLALTDDGNYSVYCINAAGLTASQSARLSVDPTFTKIMTGDIINDEGISLTCAWADYDNDGYLDLFVGKQGTNSLFHNNRDGTFTRVNQRSFPSENGVSRGCAWGDYDNDGNVDLLITNQGASNKLYHNNGDGSFSTVSGGSVSTEGGDSFGCAWGDYDRDGKLDLFVGSENALKSFLYRNSGGGLFTNILFPARYSRGCTWRDYDNDGDPDLILNAIGNQIWLNDGAGSLSPLSVPSFEDLDQNNFSLAWGDYDNDGNLDVFVAKVGRPDNLLLRNKGDGTFDGTNPMNNSRDAGYSVGGVFGDYDNDGFLDLFVINQGRRNFLYHNNGDGSFTKITTGSLANDIAFSRACSWADFDNDGFLDLFVANDGGNFCYRNSGTSNSWITLKCIGTASNRSAFGTKVKVRAVISGSVRWQVREIAGGDGLSSQETLDAHFGLGDATVVDTVRIEWPSGIVQEEKNLPVKQFLTVTELDFASLAPNYLVVAGSNATLSVAISTNLPLSYQWRFDGVDIPNATSAVLTLTNVQTTGVGNYTVVLGDFSSSVLLTTRLTLAVPPAITQQPTPASQSVSIGASVMFQVTATGAPPPAYQWRLNDVEIAGATNALLAMSSVQLADEGIFSVAVINPAGSVFSQGVTVRVDPTFTKITSGELVNVVGSYSSCAWGDYDNDGHLDLFVGSSTGTNVLYHNNGDGTFTNDSQRRLGGETYPFLTGIPFVTGIWGDIDNDGYINLFSTFLINGRTSSLIYENSGDSTFSVLDSADLLEESNTGFHLATAWADFDNDGLIDLFIGRLFGSGNFLYRNAGKGSFNKFADLVPANEGRGIVNGSPACTWGDYDNDGSPDLFVANWGTNNFLFHNNGKGVFTRITEGAPVNEGGNSQGCAWGDYDNDGFLDLFVTNVKGERNFLYHNDGHGRFTKITDGIIVNEGGRSYSCAWGDFDNDGYLDLFVTNWLGENNFLYRNNTDGTFTKILEGSLVNDGGAGSSGCAWGDYDNDGFLDLFVVNIEKYFLYRNNGNSNAWINIKCVGTASNRSAIGAKIRVKAVIRGKSVWQLTEVSGGSGFTSQNDMRANFGLGDATVVDTVRIEWPSGIVQELHDVRAKQFLTAVEPAFQITKPQSGAEGFQMTVAARKGTKQSIEVTSDLVNWTPLASVTNLDGAAKFLDPSAHDLPQRFYRVVEK